MNPRVWALCVTGALVLVGCRLIQSQERPPRPDPRGRTPEPKAPVADNSRCHVCHINYEDEKLAVRHARANMSCEKCHGASDDHCDDENNVTPPTRMYPRDAVNRACLKCHPKATLDADAAHDPLLAAAPKTAAVCTDCHGKHRLDSRTVRWDKKTGALLPEEKTPK